jgi:hypothetical protein
MSNGYESGRPEFGFVWRVLLVDFVVGTAEWNSTAAAVTTLPKERAVSRSEKNSSQLSPSSSFSSKRTDSTASLDTTDSIQHSPKCFNRASRTLSTTLE